MALTAGTRLGPYEILTSIGAGGMGEVYKATDTRLDRTVAIKVLPPDFANDPERRQRFEREARAISKLRLPKRTKRWPVPGCIDPTGALRVGSFPYLHQEGLCR